MFPVIVWNSWGGNAEEDSDNDENRSPAKECHWSVVVESSVVQKWCSRREFKFRSSRRCDHADSWVSFDKCIVGHSLSPIDGNGGRISVEATSGSAHRTFSNAGKPDSSTFDLGFLRILVVKFLRSLCTLCHVFLNWWYRKAGKSIVMSERGSVEDWSRILPPIVTVVPPMY